MDSPPNLSALERNWLYDSQWCVANQVCSCSRENRTPLKDLGPVDTVPFHGHSYRGQPLNIRSTYIRNRNLLQNLVLSSYA